MMPAALSRNGVAPALVDRHGRVKRKLRLSLTDRCNFRCRYCMPEKPTWQSSATHLTLAEVKRLSALFVRELGIRQIRLTGGEPLLRKDLPACIESLADLKTDGLDRISLTSNGALLAARATALQRAGLDDVNISLDARTPTVFRALTGADVEPVLNGLRIARDAGMSIKINSVVIRGYNDHEILPLTQWAYAERIPLRFIEFMPLDGRGFWSPEKVVTQPEILAALTPHFAINTETRSADPAAPFRLNGDYTLGIISTISAPFCASCDRVRVTAAGTLFPCLFSETGADLRALLRDSTTDATLIEAIRHTIWNKDQGYVTRQGYTTRGVSMHQLGG